MASSAAHGKQHIEASQYPQAIEAYTTALKESPTSPAYLTARSLSYQRNKQLPEALADADAAVAHAYKRAKRELIIEAQKRRGIVLHVLERYGDARFVFNLVSRMDKDAKELRIWVPRNDMKIAELGEDHEKVAVTVKEVPDIEAPKESASDQATSQNGAANKPGAPAVQQTPVDKIRHDWYQNNQNVYFTLLAKGVPEPQTQVNFTERSMSISFPVATSDSTYDFTLDPLYAPVNPAKCITRVLSTKVEIILSKATPGQKWHALESSEPVPETDSNASKPEIASAKPTSTAAPANGPSYPTSSKSGPKNWDKIVDGDDDDKDESSGDPNAFFKTLYAGATPEQQRAMMKSFTESNGTSLSTNWDEVSKGKVKTQPPDSMEAKEWAK